MTTTSTQVVNQIQLSEGEINFYKEEGYLTIPNFLNPDAVEHVRGDILKILEVNGFDAPRLKQSTETGDKLRQFPQYLKDSYLDQMINCEASLHVAGQLIGGHANRYLPFTAMKTGGGAGQFHLHQDNNYTQHDPALGSINIWVALVDMTPDNGCLLVAPRSHKAGILDWENAGDGDSHKKVLIDERHLLPVRMRAGDAIAFTRLTVHGSGPNNTTDPRVAYALQYNRDDVQFYDNKEDNWKLLTESPRFQTPPVDQLEKGW